MTKAKYIAPKVGLSAFNCPYCGAYSDMNWYGITYYTGRSYDAIKDYSLVVARCSHCQQFSLWANNSMIIPNDSTAPMPHDDIPEQVKSVYIEAREIVNRSPKGACALLRLALQMLCDQLVAGNKNINDKIGELVKMGLSPQLQKAFDIVRVVGNNAVHPGEINIDDNPEIATKLFELINLIVEKMITEPKEIAAFYDNTVPQNQKNAITKRDAATP